MTIALCLLQSSLQSCYANHSLQVRAASLPPHEGNHQRLLGMLSRGAEHPVRKDTVKPGLTSFYSSHPSPLTACIALLTVKRSPEVPSNPLQMQSRTKSRAKTSYENQIPSFTAASITERHVFSMPVTRKTFLLPSFSSTCINKIPGWPRSFYVIHFSVNRTKINVTDGSHVTLLAYSKLNGLWEHRSGQMSTLQHACMCSKLLGLHRRKRTSGRWAVHGECSCWCRAAYFSQQLS